MSVRLVLLVVAVVRFADGAPPMVHSAPSTTGIVSDSGLPNCKRTTVVEGQVTHQDINSAAVSIITSVQLQLGLRETACFHVQLPEDSINGVMTYNGSLLYTLRFAALEHHHPIKQRYEFGIPQISTKCVCDCSGGDNHCDVETHHYKNCTRGAVCYRTYHANQSPVGCPTGGESELCCEVSLNPYKDWSFWALQLSQPDTIAVFDYRLYDWSEGRWRIATESSVSVSLNKGIQSFKLDDENKLSFAVSGSKPHKQLAAGTYFVSSDGHSLRQVDLINELMESNLEKLGWFRRADEKWSVHKGLVKMTTAQHVFVTDCKAQKYTVTYTADQFVSVADDGDTAESINLGKLVTDTEPWLEQAIVESGSESRNAIISHSEGTVLTVTLTMDNRPTLRFYHHSSMLKDFNGSIYLDRESNRYLNVTFSAARGTLIGSVYLSEHRRRVDVAFSTYVGTSQPSAYTTILTLPSSVNGSRFVCFHPSGYPDQEQCKWCSFQARPLEWFLVPHRWQTNTGDCHGCNEMGVENFIQYLNPKQWFNGIGSTSETLALIFELVVYGVVIFLIIAIIRKCLWPLCKWTLCTGSSPKKV